jgi:glycosyltransferase involved in cell wall biosynthesis
MNPTKLYLKMANRKNSSILSNWIFRYIRLVFSLTNNLFRNPKVFLPRKTTEKLNLIQPQPLVSIVVPTFNQEEYLNECLDSLINQTYENFELVIVDDGSTDQTKKILSNYIKRENVRIITNEQNEGLPFTLNRGFDHCSGQVLTWVSSDNFVSSTFLEDMVRILILKNRYGVIYSDFEIVDSKSKKIGRDFGWRNYDRISLNASTLVMHSFKDVRKVAPINVVGASFLMRSEVFNSVGKYTEPQGNEDQNFWLKASEKFQFYKAKNLSNLYFYRVHKDSLSSKNRGKTYSQLLRTKSCQS